MTPPDKDELDEILEQLQYGTVMADNTEPALTNNRNIAKQAINRLIAEALLDEMEKIHGDCRSLNGHAGDTDDRVHNRIAQLQQSIKELES